MRGLITVLLTLLGTVVGAVVGGIFGFLTVIAIGTAAGDTGHEGALAMGAATGGLPVGAVIGALLGAVMVLRPRLGLGPLMGTRGWSITGLVLLGLTVVWGIRVWSITTPEFSSPRPKLLVEVKMPTDKASDTYIKKLWPTYHRAGTYVYPYNEIDRWESDGFTIARLRYVMVYRVEERSLAVQFERDKYAVFPLEIGKTPEVSDWTEWRKPSVLRSNPDLPETKIDGAPEVELRVKLRWKEQ